jgi:hypothetical protein
VALGSQRFRGGNSRRGKEEIANLQRMQSTHSLNDPFREYLYAPSDATLLPVSNFWSFDTVVGVSALITDIATIGSAEPPDLPRPAPARILIAGHFVTREGWAAVTEKSLALGELGLPGLIWSHLICPTDLRSMKNKRPISINI